jgi:peptidase M23-like protein
VKIVLIRVVLPVALLLAWAPAAEAWSWPVQGPVLRAFAFDPAHPYDAGQHRGIDIGADAAGESVVAPAAGTVSFAGTVPTSGKCVTIQTSDGYSVTLTHLGSIVVSKGAGVSEGEAVGTIGPSGTPEYSQPYVHFGIRTTSDPNGYLDPLGFLPAVPASEPTQTVTTPQPSASGASSSTPSAASSSTRKARGGRSKTHAQSHRGRGRASQARSSLDSASAESSTATSSSRRANPGQSSSQGTASDHSTARAGEHRHTPLPQLAARPASNSWRRPVVEAVSGRPLAGLDAGHETLRVRHAPSARPTDPQAPGVVLSLVLNTAAALVAMGAAVAAARRRPGRGSRPFAETQILSLPSATADRGRVRHAA